MTPTSVFPEIDGCLQGQSQGGGGGAFRRGVNCRFGFTQSRVLVGKVGKPMKIIPMNAPGPVTYGSPFLFPKGVCLSVFTSIGPWSLLQNFVILAE